MQHLVMESGVIILYIYPIIFYDRNISNSGGSCLEDFIRLPCTYLFLRRLQRLAGDHDPVRH